jgi:HK97 gp10 family phage protein
MAREGFIGLEQLRDSFKKLHQNLSGKGLHDALYAAADVFRNAIEAQTPVGSGQAKRSVIVYQRKARLAVKAEELALLVGYEKRDAYYMYFYEYGTSKQAPRPFMRAAYDSAYESAWRAMEESIKSGMMA